MKTHSYDVFDTKILMAHNWSICVLCAVYTKNQAIKSIRWSAGSKRKHMPLNVMIVQNQHQNRNENYSMREVNQKSK